MVCQFVRKPQCSYVSSEGFFVASLDSGVNCLKSTPAIFVDVIASAFVKVPMDLLPKRRSGGEWNAKSRSVFESAKAGRMSGPARMTSRATNS